MSAALVIGVLSMAHLRRQSPPGVIFHTDRGSQFASYVVQKALKKRGFVPSMSRKGNCYDNAVIESFFYILKTEEVNLAHYLTRQEAHAAVINYIIFYNQQRRHSYLGYLSPRNFEARHCA